jgi:outer membrane lipoprotein-sorting protein
MRVLSALALACALAAGDASTVSDAALAKLAALAGQVRTVQGKVTQRTLNPGKPEPEVRTGDVAFAFPDKYNLLWRKPDAPGWRERWCSDGTWWWTVEQEDEGEQADKARHRVGEGDADRRRLVDQVHGDLASLQQEFTVVAGILAEGGYVVTLTPRPDAPSAADVARGTLRYDAKGHLQTLAIDLSSGTRIEVQVESAQYDQPIPPETFRGPDP